MLVNIENLTSEQISLLNASDRYYLGQETGMSDKEYDTARAKFKIETGKDIFSFLAFDGIEVGHRHLEDLRKDIIDGDLTGPIKKFLIENGIDPENILGNVGHLSPKYDGCSLVGYYSEDGFRQRILSGDNGLDRTDKLKHCFPEKVTPGIFSIQAEALVDWKTQLNGEEIKEGARQKANGLVNSKYLQDEVNELITVRAYKINYYDGVYDYERMSIDLSNLPQIKNDKGRILFWHTDIFQPNAIPQEPMVSLLSGNFVIDGVVVYTKSGVQGFKFYYTEWKDTVITNIEYNQSGRLGYFPTAIYESVQLNGTWCSKASLGSMSNMMELGVGIGAKVRIAKAGATIPQIIKVLEKSDVYNEPKCNCCGKQLSVKDSLFGSVLKCTNIDCQSKIDRLTEHMNWFIKEKKLTITNVEELKTALISEYFMFFGDLLFIDRFQPYKKYKGGDKIESVLNVITWLETDNYEAFYSDLEARYWKSGLQESMFKIMCKAVFVTLKNLYNSIKN